MDHETSTLVIELLEKIKKADRELNLECQQFHLILNEKKPELAEHVKGFQETLRNLSEGLNSFNEHLQSQYAAETTPDMTPETSIAPEEYTDISASEASHQRHDDHITLADIFRGLLMADEPAQRRH